MGENTIYSNFITFCATELTDDTVARGRRPRATVHRVFHSTEGVIVMAIAQKGMEYLFY